MINRKIYVKNTNKKNNNLEFCSFFYSSTKEVGFLSVKYKFKFYGSVILSVLGNFLTFIAVK